MKRKRTPKTFKRDPRLVERDGIVSLPDAPRWWLGEDVPVPRVRQRWLFPEMACTSRGDPRTREIFPDGTPNPVQQN